MTGLSTDRFRIADATARCACALVVLALAVSSAQAAVLFEQAFSPQKGLTAPVEQPWRQEICLNGSWQFQPVSLPADYAVEDGAPLLPEPAEDGWSATPIRIPSPWNINAYARVAGRSFPSYPKSWEEARMGWLRRTFRVPSAWEGKRLILHFEAVCGYVQVFVNGQPVADHFENSLPFLVDVTDFVDREGENTLLLGIRQAGLFDVPGMFGRFTYASGGGWTQHLIGVWQDVFLRALPALRVESIAVRPYVDQDVLELEVVVRNDTARMQAFRLGGEIRPWISEAGSEVLAAPVPASSLGEPVVDVSAVEATLGPRRTVALTLRRPIEGVLRLWTPETPNLYGLVLDIAQDGQPEDRFYQRFGWRQWGIDGRDVTLNGEPYQLRGESEHMLGVPHLSRRVAWAWFKSIKDVNGNAIRLHASIRPRFYLELADEMGIAILDESEIYASTMKINYREPVTWLRFRDHLEQLVLRDRNYPSVFGWSLGNEVLSALWWRGTPRKYWPPVIDGIVGLADDVRALDPTRPWISCDGDGDFHGKLPTFMYHYGKPQDWNRQAPENRPFGVGEGGSMVWGSPAVFSVYNGERSYESALGMEEGTAIETYYYLTEQRKMAAFCSVFTINGACFRQLPLGLGDEGQTQSSDAGIVFGPFVEGQPGMQPERIAPYSTNFNPGFDPSLPLYQTTPVFEAVKAAYTPGGPQPCEWDHLVQTPPRPEPPKPTLDEVAFLGDAHGALMQALESSGVAARAGAGSGVLVIDGATLTAPHVSEARRAMGETLGRDGTVFVWLGQDSIEQANAFLPEKVALVPEASTALFADRDDPETAPMALADLFFADEADPVIMRHGMTGPLVGGSRVLMTSNSITETHRIITQGPRVPALIAPATDRGRLLVTTLLPDVRSTRRLELMRCLFANLGVRLQEPSDLHDTGFDGAGFLNQALLLGAFQGEPYPEILDIDFIGDEASAEPRPGDRVDGRQWTLTRALGSGLFDFFRLGIPGTEGTRARMELHGVLKPEALDANNYLESAERVSGMNPGTNSVVYVSFWLRAPRDVDSSELTMLMRSDDGAKVWVNARQVFVDRSISGPGQTDPALVAMTLHGGWNHVLAKVGQLDGLWNLSIRFESSDPELWSRLHARPTR